MEALCLLCLHNDVAELHKSAVSLSRLSIRNYALDLNPNSLLLFLFVPGQSCEQRATKMRFFPRPLQSDREILL